MEALHRKSVRRDWWNGLRIYGWDVISGITTHLSTFSWKDEDKIRSVRREIPTSYSEIVLMDMTPIK
jgi:hypothetical protein